MKCPLFTSNRELLEDCLETNCGFWHKEEKSCAIVSLANSFHWFYKELPVIMELIKRR